MEFIFKRVGKREYDFIAKKDENEEITPIDREIIAFAIYLQLTGEAIIDAKIVGRPLFFSKHLAEILHPDKYEE